MVADKKKKNGRTILITGATGFIGRRLLSGLIEDDPDITIISLVQEKFIRTAEIDIEEILKASRTNDTVLKAVPGDITLEKLGLDDAIYNELTDTVTEIWHLAAIYDLSISYDTAKRINVQGTINVLKFCKECHAFSKLLYYSTVVVSGDRTGVALECELDVGQKFKNHYEHTKFLAEKEVRDFIRKGNNAIIIRPAVVVGDSRTGETDKFDGPYFAMRFIDRFKWAPIRLPRPGKSEALLNIVPVDYLVDATIVISKKKEALGKTFQIVDPNPIQARKLYDQLCKLITGKPSGIRIWPPLIKAFLSFWPVKTFVRVPAPSLAYFNNEIKYDTSETLKILQVTGITCPRLPDYLLTLYKYWDKNKKKAGFDAKM